MKKARELSSDDKKLWNNVSGTIKKSINHNTDEDINDDKALGKRSFKQKKESLVLTTASNNEQKKLNHASTSMDKNILKRLKRGKLIPEAKLDLHGLTSQEAHQVLIPFIISNYKQNKRLLLVITGKGQKNYDREYGSVVSGVLRQRVPQWLRINPIGVYVLDFVEAHQKDGGSGALYVYLKKTKRL